MQLRVLASSALLAATLAAQAQAQPTTSSITGRALDATGAVLPGVRVAARHLETGLVREAESGSGGEFVLPAVPVGAYEVTAALAGFRPLAQRVTVVLGEPALLPLVLEPGATDEITVTGDAVSVQTRGGQLSYLVSEKTVSDLPLNGRNYTDLVFLQPGVLSFPHRDFGSIVAHGRAASINGQDPRSNVYLLDGTLQNDFTNGPAGSAASTALGTETVREFRVETNAYSAEFGRNSGGQINVLTKSGQNDWHGSLYEYHRNDALDARNFFDPDQKPDFRRNQFGGTLAGPLRRDRSFFFVGYEGLRERLGRTISTVVPDEAARQGILPSPGGGSLVVPVSPAVRPYLDEFPLPNGANLGGGLAAFTFPFDETVDQDYFQARLDQNLGRGDQLFVRYTLDHARQELPTDFPQFPRSFESTNQFLTGEYRRVFSARVLATLARRLEPHSRRPGGRGEHLAAARRLRARPRVDGRHRHHGHPALRPAELRRRAAAPGRVLARGRRQREPRPAPAEGRRPRRALRIRPRQPDVQPRHLHLREPRVVPAQPAAAFRGAHARGRLPAPLAVHAPGPLPAGRMAGARAAHALRGPAPRVRRRCRATRAAATSHSSTSRARLQRSATSTGTRGPACRRGSRSPGTSLGDGKTALRGGYGLYYNTNGQQHLIVTVTNPPFTPRPVLVNPSFPQPNFAELGALSIRPYQWDIETPRVHVFNLNLQRQLGHGTLATIGYAGSRG